MHIMDACIARRLRYPRLLESKSAFKKYVKKGLLTGRAKPRGPGRVKLRGSGWIKLRGSGRVKLCGPGRVGQW